MKTRIARGSMFFRTILSLLSFSCLLVSAPDPAVASDKAIAGTISPDPSRLWSPGKLAVDSDGTLYVVDAYKNRVRKFSGKGDPLGSIRASRPAAVAAAPDGTVYIGSHADYAVSIYKAGEPAGYLGAGRNEFKSIGDIAVDNSSGDVYVVDTKANMVKVYYATGAAKGKLQGFTAPAAAAVTDTEVIVLDAPVVPCPTEIMVEGKLIPCPECTGPCSGSRILVLDKTGKRIRDITESNNMIRPVDLAVDGNGNIFVADALKKVILVYDRTLKFIGELASGQHDLRSPLSLALSRDNSLYVSSSGTRSITEVGLAGTLHSAQSGFLNFQSNTGAAISLGVLGY